MERVDFQLFFDIITVAIDPDLQALYHFSYTLTNALNKCRITVNETCYKYILFSLKYIFFQQLLLSCSLVRMTNFQHTCEGFYEMYM